MDFTVNEEMIIDRDLLQYPKDPNEARERWRKRLKYDILVLKTDKEKKTAAAEPVKEPNQSAGDSEKTRTANHPIRL